MDERPLETVPADGQAGALPVAAEDFTEVSPETFREGFGEDLRRTLDLATWPAGGDLSAEYRRIEEEVRLAVGRETDLHRRMRTEVFPKLPWRPGAPPGAGKYEVAVAEVEKVHRGLLFNGGV